MPFDTVPELLTSSPNHDGDAAVIQVLECMIEFYGNSSSRWIKHRPVNRLGAMCLIGAAAHYAQRRYYPCRRSHVFAVLTAIERALPTEYRPGGAAPHKVGGDPSPHIAWFNDHPTTTFADIQHVLRDALDTARNT